MVYQMKRAAIATFIPISVLLLLAVSCRGALTAEVELALTQTALAPYVATRVSAAPQTSVPLDWGDLLKITPTSQVVGALGILVPVVSPTPTPPPYQLRTPQPTPTYPLDLFPPTGTPEAWDPRE